MALGAMDTYGFPLTWSLSVSINVSSRDAFDLAPGQQSPPVSRPDAATRLVQVTGNNVNNLDKQWSCIGDDSTTPQTSTSSFLSVTTSEDDLTMDCALAMSNPSPSTLVITQSYPDAPSATSSYAVSYASSIGGSPGSIGPLADGESASLTTWQSQSLVVVPTIPAGAWLTGVECENSTGPLFTRWNAFRPDAEISNFQMRPDDTTTCEFQYSPLGTITVIEDIVPDSAASTVGADYSVTPVGDIAVGPSSFSLLDGQSETLTIEYRENVQVRREILPEFVLDDRECVRIVNGVSEPFSPSGSWSSSGFARLNFRVGAGEDYVCTFTSSPAGPPEVSISQDIVVIDPTAYDDLQVEVRDATTNALIATVDAGTSNTGSSPGFLLELPERGSYTLTVLNAQGLDIDWNCGTGTGATTTIDILRGQVFGCRATADENPPTGTGTMNIEKASSPDASLLYGVTVSLGAYPIDGGRISESMSMQVTDLAAGTYVITESSPINQNLTSVVCGIAPVSAITRTAGNIDGQSFWINRFTVEIGVGADITCELINELVEPPTLLDVYVDVNPSDGTEAYTLDISPTSAVVAGSSSRSVLGGTVETFVLANDTEVTITQSALAGYVTMSSCYGPPEELLSQTFTTPALGGTVSCFFDNGAIDPIVNVSTITVPPGSAQSFSYSVTPSASTNSFSHVHGESTEITFEVGGDDPVIAQTPVPGFDTFADCYDPSFDVGPTLIEADSVTYPLFSGAVIECVFENRPAAPTYDITLNAVVSTGPVDRADLFSFDTQASGLGIRGPAGTGVARTFTLGDSDSTTFSINEGSEVTIDATDALAGAAGFEYSIDCGVYFEVNQPVVFTPANNVECAITFEARTVAVNKVVDPGVIAGFDQFDIEIAPALGGTGAFTLGDGEQDVAVVALTATAELTELNPDPYDATIQCTENTFAGATVPPTGPFGGDTVGIAGDRSSYECDVINSVGAVPIYEVSLRSELDLGAVAIPARFPGIDVDFDGDLSDGEFEQPDFFGPGGASSRAARLVAPVFGAPSSGLLETVTVAPNGTVSVFVVDGGDVTIDAGLGSEQFTTTLTCPSGTTNADGSVTLTSVGAATTCVMTNEAGNVTLSHSVIGPTSETAWPFTIGNVLAGPSTASLGDGDSVTVAVGVDQPTLMTQTDTLGASMVTSGCGTIGVTPFTSLRSLTASMLDITESVTVSGGESVTCAFISTYDTTAPPTTPPTTEPPAPPTTDTPTSTVAPPTTDSPTATTVPPSGVTTTTTTLPPQVPFAPPRTVPPVSFPTTTTTTTTTTVTTVVTTTLPSSQPPATTIPDDPPPPVITTDTPDVFVDIGDPIPVEIDCAGETAILVNGIEQDRVDQIEPSALGLGDHVIEVRCDGDTITEVRAIVYEQDEGAPAGSNMTVIVMFVVMAVGAFIFAPSAASRKRLPV